MDIKPIETVYKGYKFRSRLEARWAVFFDALEIRWEYEPEGYRIGPHCLEPDQEGMCPDYRPYPETYECMHRRMYLPDFRLPDQKSWVEVKGVAEKLDFDLLADAVDWGEGLPDMAYSMGQDRGLLILGPIPSAQHSWIPCHPILQHDKGGWVGLAHFRQGGFTVRKSGMEYFDSSTGSQTGDFWTKEVVTYFEGGKGYSKDLPKEMSSIQHAYLSARQARFEHGEKG